MPCILLQLSPFSMSIRRSSSVQEILEAIIRQESIIAMNSNLTSSSGVLSGTVFDVHITAIRKEKRWQRRIRSRGIAYCTIGEPRLLPSHIGADVLFPVILSIFGEDNHHCSKYYSFTDFP